MELVLTALLAPLALALLPLLWKDLIGPVLERRRKTTEAMEASAKAEDTSVVQGQVLDLTVVAVGALQAHAKSLGEQLLDEQADHARCDALLREHHVPVPHD